MTLPTKGYFGGSTKTWYGRIDEKEEPYWNKKVLSSMF